MSRIDDIITKARYTLADTAGTRFSTARLLDLVDEAQKQIVISANLLRAKAGQPIRNSIALYDVPDDCYKPIRILVHDLPLKMVSHEAMDRQIDTGAINASSYSWEDITGDIIECIVYDKLNPGTIKLYPIPSLSFTDISLTLQGVTTLPETPSYNTDYGFVVSATDYVVTQTSGLLNVGQQYVTRTYVATDDFTNVADIGALANVSGAIWTAIGTTPTDWTNASTLSRDFGIAEFIAEFIDSTDSQQYYDLLGTLNITGDEAHGLITVFEDASTDIVIYYLKRPDDITATTDELEIDEFWDMYIKYYVAGMALSDNKDTQDRALGAAQLQLFASGVQKAKADASHDFTATRTQYVVPYNGGFLG